MIKRILLLALSLLCFSTIFSASTDKKSNNTGKIVAKDAFGRKADEVSGYKKDRYVGLFYFTWLGFSGTNKVFDVTKILRDNPEALWSTDSNNIISPVNSNHFFNEPLYGYYNSADPWVIRKHIELFIAADIDFLALDFTNAIVYEKVLNVLLETLEEYRLAGFKVPQLTFFTNTQSGKVVGKLYEMMYSKNLYPELWFYGPYDKPLMIAWENELPQEQQDFFHIRPPQWPEADFVADGFPYVEKVRPQRVYTDLVSVSVAQHFGGAFSWSLNGPHGKISESWGRGYTSNNKVNGNTDNIERGANFQEQWDYAISVDPKIIFVTGFNEWIACKFVNKDKAQHEFYGDEPYWVDTFNTEFSRDVEMTKSRGYVKDENGKTIEEGYGDNFYLQLIRNVRKYKGIASDKTVKTKTNTINIYGNGSEWDSVDNVYLNTAVKKTERNYIGFSDRTRYTQEAPDNFIKNIKVTHDKNNLYFRIETDTDITAHEQGKTNWMNLFIGVEGKDSDPFESYHYVINRSPSSDTKTSLEVSKGGYDFDRLQDIDYSLQGNTIQFSVPRKALGLKRNFSIYFKAADSIEKESDIMDYYVSGCSVPMGRMSFSYKANDKISLNMSTFESILLALSSLIIISCCSLLLIKSFKGRKNNEKV